jgi:hypothetical protein
MQDHIAISAGLGSILDMELCERGCRLALERADIGSVSQEQCGGMVKIKGKSLFHRVEGLLLFLQGLQ